MCLLTLTMNIRPAEKNDLVQIVKLCKVHAEYEQAEYASDNKIALLSEALFGESSSLNCLVVESNNYLLGYATFMKQFSTWDAEYYVYLDCLYLAPETRGQGIGQKVMAQIKAYAKAENCKVIQWQTPEFNKVAIRFYNRLGAKSKSKERFFWEV